MQVNKSLLKKIVGLIAVFCFAMVMAVGLIGCGKDDKQLTKDDKVVENVVLSDNKFQITYVDGTKADYALTSVKDVKVLENGQTEITYADGTKATIGKADCDHTFTASADIKPASCSGKGVKIQVCEKCGYVESIEIEKNPNVHGVWVLRSEVEPGELDLDVDEDNGIITYSRDDSGLSLYRLETSYVYGSMTILEGYSGVADNCFEAECALCGKVFAEGHKPVSQWVNIVVDDANVNICENEHTVYKTCPTCKSVLLYEDSVIVAEKEPALGHIYGDPIVGNKITTADPNYYEVKLTCERCGEDQEVRAYLKDTVNVSANCRNDGYKYSVYEYTYYNYVDGVRKTLTGTIEVERETFTRTGEHTLADGLMFGAYSITAQTPNYEYNPLIAAQFAAGKIRWSEGVPANCSDHMPAVFTCMVCNEQIVISLSGEHAFSEEVKVPATCTTDGYSQRTCSECNYVWQYDEVKATGHNYKYKDGSFNETELAATFVCTKCGNEVVEDVTVVSITPAETCKSVTTTKYKAVLNTGIADDITTSNVDESKQTVEFEIKAADEVKLHTLASVEGLPRYQAFSISANGPMYEYNDLIAAQFAAGKIRWSEGVPANCSDYKAAVFKCTVCGEDIVIALSGEHLAIDASDKQEVAASCTERGYVAYKCTDCGNYIEQTATDAKGHTFAPKEDSWAAFVAATNKDRMAVEFECTTCHNATIVLYAKESHTNGTSGCVTTDTYRYDFYTAADNETNYTYQVETAEQTQKTLTFAYNWTYSENVGTHLIGTYNGRELRVIGFNMRDPDAYNYEYGEAFGMAFDDGKIAWNEGNPATCSSYELAVFECVTCTEKVVFKLSGEHTPGSLITEDSDCTHAGRSYKICSVCNAIVDETPIPAKGHDYGTWEVGGTRSAVAYEQDGVVSLGSYELGYATSTCSRCQDELTAEGQIMSTTLPTCGKEGQLVVKYVYDGNTVATTTITIPKIDHHLDELNTAEHVIKWVDNGTYYLGYVCGGCGELIVTDKSQDETVIDDIIATLTRDYVNELLGRS